MTGEAMRELMNALPVVVVAVIGILLVLTGTIAIVLYLAYRFRGHYKNGEVYFEKDPQITVEKEFLKDMIILDIQKKIDIILFRELHHKKMEVVRKYTQQTVSHMREVFLGLIMRLDNGDLLGRDEAVKQYKQITDILQSWMVEHMETEMNRDAFSKLSDKEFGEYLKESLTEIYKKIHDFIDNGFHHRLVPLDQLHAEHKKEILEYQRFLSSVYIEAKIIKIEMMAEVKALLMKQRKIQDHYIRTREVLIEPVEGCDGDNQI